MPAMDSSSIMKAHEEVNELHSLCFVSLLREPVGGGVGEEVQLRWFPHSLTRAFLSMACSGRACGGGAGEWCLKVLKVC